MVRGAPPPPPRAYSTPQRTCVLARAAACWSLCGMRARSLPGPHRAGHSSVCRRGDGAAQERSPDWRPGGSASDRNRCSGVPPECVLQTRWWRAPAGSCCRPDWETAWAHSLLSGVAPPGACVQRRAGNLWWGEL